jgi:hypothetical protein
MSTLNRVRKTNEAGHGKAPTTPEMQTQPNCRELATANAVSVPDNSKAAEPSKAAV